MFRFKLGFEFHFRTPLGLLPFIAFFACLVGTARATNSVTEAWAARLVAPADSFFQAGGIAVGPSGDLFVTGYLRYSDSRQRIQLSRHTGAGGLVWKKAFEPAGYSALYDFASGFVARGTNLYITGTSTDTNGSADVLTLKYRDDGELDWAVRFDGAAHGMDRGAAIAVDAQDNVIVAGETIGADGSLDFLVVKYGPNGNLLWSYSRASQEDISDRVVTVRLDAAGNIFVLGTSTSGDSQNDAATLKLSPGGQELWVAWERSSNFYGIDARGLDVDSDGDVVVIAHELSQCVTWKYNTNGNLQWKRRFRAEEPAGMNSFGVRFDRNGNIIAAVNYYGAGVNHGILIKYAPDGQQLWATRITDINGGVTHFHAFALDADGNSYVTTSPSADVLTVKIGGDGSQRWTTSFNSTNFFYDYGEFLQIGPANELFVVGRSVYLNEYFTSLVKYTQQPVPGLPTAIVMPAEQLVDPGATVAFTTQATGDGPFQFHWRMNGRPISDATNATLVLTNVQAADRGDYSVVISNPVGATVSPEGRLSVRIPPEVTITPTNVVAYPGTIVSFVATLDGNDFVVWQWRQNGTNVPGATNAIFQLVNMNASATGFYDVVASTVGGTTTSSAAGLRISGAVELVGVTPHRSSFSTWDYIPRLLVLPDGDFLLAVRTNHSVYGSAILLRKQAENGSLLWSSLFQSAEFTNAEPTSLARDAAGNIYVAGVSRQPYLPAAAVLLKYGPAGDLIWSRTRLESNSWGLLPLLAVDSDGNSTVGTLDGGIKITRYNAEGDVQWVYDERSPDIDTLSLAVDSGGSSYVGTTLRIDHGNGNEIRLRKFDAAGTNLWTRTADAIYSRLAALAIDSGGNLIVAGTGELTDVPDSRMFVAKYSPAGSRLWETRTGGSWSELSYIVSLAVGPDDDISVLTESDDDFWPAEQCGLTRVSADGQLRYRIGEPQILTFTSSQLAVDRFGNTYVTGYGWRPVTGADVVTAKYDAQGNRMWMVYHGGPDYGNEFGLSVGADAAGNIRVLVNEGSGSETSTRYSLLLYRQRDPASSYRLRLIPDAAGTYHLSVPSGEPFQIEASTDMRTWMRLGSDATQRLLAPGATTYADSPQRFYRWLVGE